VVANATQEKHVFCL